MAAAKTMTKRSLILLVLSGELLLAGIALFWISFRDLPLQVGSDGWCQNVVSGVCTAGLLALCNYGLLWWAPPIRVVRVIRQLYRQTLRPLVADIGPLDVVVIAAAAGIGEELMFRGALQPEIGLVPSSLIFGLLHMDGRGTLAFGCWVTLMGIGLGWLAILTQGLLAPTIAHGVYDAAALIYLRWGPEGSPMKD